MMSGYGGYGGYNGAGGGGAGSNAMGTGGGGGSFNYNPNNNNQHGLGSGSPAQGGFSYSQGGGGASQVSGGKRRREEQTMRPVMIKQLQEAKQSHGDSNFSVDDEEISQVCGCKWEVGRERWWLIKLTQTKLGATLLRVSLYVLHFGNEVSAQELIPS